jgi:hypothetical protein
MDPSGSAVWMETVVLVGVFAVVGFILFLGARRDRRVKRETSGNGDGGSPWSGDCSGDSGGDGGGD